MADTVEQVYVWDGNDWTPVVRDETVSNTSELTNDGEDGVNPFITAADIPAVPDKKLPISSADDTVVLDSPSANTFTISTDGEERVKVDPNGRFLVGQNAGANPNFDAHFHKNGWNQLVVESVSSNAQIKMIADTLMFYDTVDPISRAWRKTYYNIDTAASINTLTVDTSGNLEVAGQVRTSRIVGPADTDASLELGANAAIVSPVVYLGSQTGSPEGTATVMPGDSVGAGRNLVISSGKPKAAADEGSAISLATAEGNGVSRAPATRMYIASTGNVGIDNVTPDERLVVGGNIRTNRVKGFDPNPMIVLENQQATLLDSTEGTYTATDPNSIATKQTVDDKIQVMTTAEYNALAAKNPTTLYCLTD